MSKMQSQWEDKYLSVCEDYENNVIDQRVFIERLENLGFSEESINDHLEMAKN